jgi:hypothetical protein
MELDGMPLHPLVNDAVVALVPLSVLAAWAFALLPSWRWLGRWAALLSSLAALPALFVTWLTGRELLEQLAANIPPDQPVFQKMQIHQDRADVLLWSYVAFTVVVVLAFLLLPAPTRLADGRMAFAGSRARWVALAVPAALVVVGLFVLVSVVLTGHAGAQIVWGQ